MWHGCHALSGSNLPVHLHEGRCHFVLFISRKLPLTIRAKLCDRTVSWVLRGTPAFHTNSKLDTCYSLCGHGDPDTSLYLFHFTTCRVSSGGAFSRTFNIRSALRTKPVPLCASTGTGASSAVLRNVCSWACPEMVSSSWHCVLDSVSGVCYRPTYVTSSFKP